jgi:hypothetical protein
MRSCVHVWLLNDASKAFLLPPWLLASAPVVLLAVDIADPWHIPSSIEEVCACGACYLWHRLPSSVLVPCSGVLLYAHCSRVNSRPCSSLAASLTCLKSGKKNQIGLLLARYQTSLRTCCWRSCALFVSRVRTACAASLRAQSSGLPTVPIALLRRRLWTGPHLCANRREYEHAVAVFASTREL